MNRLSLTFLLLVIASTTQADSPLAPVFDAHVHYNLDIGRPVSVERVFELWREAGIRGVLLTSRPNDGTRELLEKAPAEFKTVAFVAALRDDGRRADLVPRSGHLRHDRA